MVVLTTFIVKDGSSGTASAIRAPKTAILLTVRRPWTYARRHDRSEEAIVPPEEAVAVAFF
jgi:hypothetical protein